jgi:AraC family transcriptional regulator
VMATLRGGARRHRYVTADGLKVDGPDLAGSVSFLAAGCERRLELTEVEWRWAAVAFDPDERATPASFAADCDRLILELSEKLERVEAADGGIDPLYGEAVQQALCAYLAKRFGQSPSPSSSKIDLPAWKLRLVHDHVAAHLGGPLSLRALAEVSGLSVRHFQRAYRATTGRTPLQYITARRVEEAKLMLAAGEMSVLAVSVQVGFGSPTHFARTFRASTGVSPSEYRRQHGLAAGPRRSA